jgi:hypothetical protein
VAGAIAGSLFVAMAVTPLSLLRMPKSLFGKGEGLDDFVGFLV